MHLPLPQPVHSAKSSNRLGFPRPSAGLPGISPGDVHVAMRGGRMKKVRPLDMDQG